VVLISSAQFHPSIRIALIPILLAGIWVQGKRSIVALTLLGFLFSGWRAGVLRGSRILAAGLCAVGMLAGFSAFYQSEIRTTATGQRVERTADSPGYLYTRIDYGRDAGIRLAIHAEIDPNSPAILEYRGESIVFAATAALPRSMWPGKPYPYSFYSTARALGIRPRNIGWGITTSWLEEAIANFGWFGLLIGPLVPALVCNIGDRRQSSMAGLLTASVASLLLAVQVPAFLPIVALWLVSLLGLRMPRQKHNRRTQGQLNRTHQDQRIVHT
jgi:hypothetical protein